MSLLDRIIDNRDPGEVGKINLVKPLPYVAKPHVLVFRASVALILLALGAWFVVRSEDPVLGVVAFGAYLAISYLVVPQADTKNLGYLGYTDRPLRWTDWANRYFFVFRLLLWPGRFALSALRDAYWHARGRRTIVLYRRVEDDGDGDA
jgi:hypothetical protein